MPLEIFKKPLPGFRKKTGQEPKLIALNQNNERFANEADDGIRVVTPKSIKA